MSYHLISVILPVYRQADHVAAVASQFEDVLAKLPIGHELVLVPNGRDDGTGRACRALAAERSTVRVVESDPGWGRAVKAGLAAAEGDLLCFTNSARTSPDELLQVVLVALGVPGTVVKANRRTRDNWRRQLGSFLFNLECRALFDLAGFDVNGTPKVFPRAHGELLELRRSDDLLDAEFNVVCRRAGYRVVEVPIVSTHRHGGRSTTSYKSAVRMYWGALALWGSMWRNGR